MYVSTPIGITTHTIKHKTLTVRIFSYSIALSTPPTRASTSAHSLTLNPPISTHILYPPPTSFQYPNRKPARIPTCATAKNPYPNPTFSHRFSLPQFCRAVFVVTKTFPNFKKLLNPSGTYWFYSACCFLSFVFCYWLVPETKGTMRDDTA